MPAILPVQLNQPGGHPLSLIYHLHHHCSFYCQTNMQGFCSLLHAIIVIVSHSYVSKKATTGSELGQFALEEVI